MDKIVEKVFFALIRFEICGAELGDVKKLITAEILPPLLNLAKKHDLAHLIADALNKNGFLPQGSETRKRFYHEYNMAIYRYEQQRYEFERICQVLENAKITFMPLKGSVLREYYPEAWMRTSCDIDILIQERDLQLATNNLMKELNYTVSQAEGVHDISLLSPSGVNLELHFALIENDFQLDKVLKRAWEYNVPSPENLYKHQFTDEFFCVHLILHMAYHLIVGGGCGVRSLLDIWLLNKRGYNKEEVIDLCRECGLSVFYQKINDLANACMTEVELLEEQKELLCYILGSGMYGDLSNRVALRQVKKNGRIGLLFSRLFLSFDELSLYYPVLKRKKILFPFYQVVRWVALFFGKNSKNFKKELVANFSLENADKERARRIVEILGLRDN